jgi:hypothetical protein
MLKHEGLCGQHNLAGAIASKVLLFGAIGRVGTRWSSLMVRCDIT